LTKSTSMRKSGIDIALFLYLLLLRNRFFCYLYIIDVLYLALKRHSQIVIIRDIIIEKLPIENYNILKYLIEFLNLVKTYSYSIK
jgi:hypothetical protein